MGIFENVFFPNSNQITEIFWKLPDLKQKHKYTIFGPWPSPPFYIKLRYHRPSTYPC